MGYDTLIVCGFAFDPHVSEEVKRYGSLTVLDSLDLDDFDKPEEQAPEGEAAPEAPAPQEKTP